MNKSVNVQKNDREIILLRPEMYIRSVITSKAPAFMMTREGVLVEEKRYHNAGLVHLALEHISNASDNGVRNGALAFKGPLGESPARILFEVTPRMMRVTNYGTPFDIDFMPGTNGVLIPEACFLMAKVSSNYNDHQEALNGAGRNGHGAKIGAFYSKYLKVTCVDAERKRYFQFEIWNNGDINTIKRAVWPSPVDGKFPESSAVAGGVPPGLVPIFAAGSSTCVEWIPDHEDGDLGEAEIAAFEATLEHGQTIKMRRVEGEEAEILRATVSKDARGTVLCTLDGRQMFGLRQVRGLRQLQNGISGAFSGPTVRIFQGISSIGDTEIDICARYCADFALGGHPMILRRTWSDGQSREDRIAPLSLVDYGKKIVGPDAQHHYFEWKSPKVELTMQIAFFDTPNAGRIVTHVNCLYASTGIHINPAYYALLNKLKKTPEIMKYAPKIDLAQLKQHVTVVIFCRGHDPKQDGQTKSGLAQISGIKTFTVDEVPDAVVAKMCQKWKALETITSEGRAAELAQAKAGAAKTKLDGFIKANIEGPGSMLVLTEGDSCKTYAAILKNQQPNWERIGIFPLRGVPPNLYGEDAIKAYANSVFAAILKITRLDPEKKYTCEADLAGLRYGHIVFMGDPDLDGYHIVALMIANILNYWPFMLLQHRVGALRTPVIRIYGPGKNNVLARYYSDREYALAEEAGTAPRGKVKRIKGLGSVDVGTLNKPGAELLDDFRTASVMWFNLGENGPRALDIFFSSSGAAQRRDAIVKLAPTCLDTVGVCIPDASTTIFPLGPAPLMRREVISYVAKELLQFSLGNLARHVPARRDALKDVQRKIVAWWLEHSNFGTKENSSKVAQMIGKISDDQHYHHGEMSLGKAIKRMAVDGFCGANNMPFFAPAANLGSKLRWPDDAAADRYAFVKSAPWIKHAFHKFIYECIPRVVSDGQEVEPEWIPCDVPLAVLNGWSGIPTGWRTYSPACHPVSIVRWLIARAAGKSLDLPVIIHWYSHFRGYSKVVSGENEVDVTYDEDGNPVETEVLGADRSVKFFGAWKLDGNVLRIMEVPPELRLDHLHNALNAAEEDGLVSKYLYDLRRGIDYRILLTPKGVAAYNDGSLMRTLRLTACYHLSMLWFLDETGAAVHYDNIYDYMEYFFQNTVHGYALGRDRIVANIDADIAAMQMKARYIEACVQKVIHIGEMNRAQIIAKMAELGLDPALRKTDAGDLTVEGIAEINAKIAEKRVEREQVLARTPERMYYDNLVKLSEVMPQCPLPYISRRGNMG
jgi:DNA gyrase/topoisomerase IV subunit B